MNAVIAKARNFSSFTTLAIALVSIVYVVQVATPLRLITDGIEYLMQASSAVDGAGFRVHAVKTIHPSGYPALIFVLGKAGVGKSWAIVALNCLLVGIGCSIAYVLLRRSLQLKAEIAQLICLMTLLSSVMIRNVTSPLSDISYFCASSACLLLLLRAEAESGSGRFWRLILVLSLLAFTIEIRMVGIALIPAFLWSMIGGEVGARKIARWLQERKLTPWVVMLLLVAVTYGIIRTRPVLLRSDYVQFNLPIVRKKGVLGTIGVDFLSHTTEWAEIMLNVTIAKTPHLFRPALHIVGLLPLLLCGTGIWLRRGKLDSVVLYMIAFSGIVLLYPWCDTRLWLPVLPLLMGYVALGVIHYVPARRIRAITVPYCALYCLIGVVALGYTTRITLAGRGFPDLYGDGRLAATYRLALFGEAPKNPKDIDQDALYLLRRYEWRVKATGRAEGPIPGSE